MASVFYDIRNLLLRPEQGWSALAEGDCGVRSVFRRLVWPLLAVITVCSVVGAVLFASRETFSLSFVVKQVLVLLTVLPAGLYLSVFVVDTLLLYIGQRNRCRLFTLMAYSSSVVYLVIALLRLFPFFDLLMLLALYAVYLYWCGIPKMLEVQAGKRNLLVAITFAAMIVVHFVLWYVIAKILNAIF